MAQPQTGQPSQGQAQRPTRARRWLRRVAWLVLALIALYLIAVLGFYLMFYYTEHYYPVATPGHHLDSTLGGRGYVTHNGAAGDVGYTANVGNAVTIDGSGRIVVAGYSHGAFGRGDDLALWRFNADGSLDTTFGGRGYVTHHNAAGGEGSDRARAVAIDGAGRIVVAGSSLRSHGAYNHNDLALWRFTPEGRLDTTFGGKGYVTHHDAAGGGSYDVGTAVAIDGAGRIVVGGYSWGGDTRQDLVVWRFDRDGRLDPAFGDDHDGDGMREGWVTHHNAALGMGHDRGHALAIDDHGRIVVAGSSERSTASYRVYKVALRRDDNLAVWRYNSDGHLDPTFGLDYDGDGTPHGALHHHDAAGGGDDDGGLAVAIDGSGRIVVAGYSDEVTNQSQNYTRRHLAVWRFLNQAQTPQ